MNGRCPGDPTPDLNNLLYRWKSIFPYEEASVFEEFANNIKEANDFCYFH